MLLVTIKKYTDKIKQKCPECDLAVIAKRINGFYAGSKQRIFLWECPLCDNIWRRVRPMLKDSPSTQVLQ